MLYFTGWILSAWNTIPRDSIEQCKPYNPILGEVFKCSWDYDGSEIEYIAEQVSHHPPISAFFAKNEKKKWIIWGWLNPIVSYSLNSVKTKFDGKLMLDYYGKGEKYEITLPQVLVKGILWGNQSINGHYTMIITCPSNETKAIVKFLDSDFKGYIQKKDENLFFLEGRLDGSVSFTDLKTGEKDRLYDQGSCLNNSERTEPIEKQASNESRKLWEPVTKALEIEDFDKATIEKQKIEKTQRDWRAKNADWKPKLFHFNGNCWIYNHYKTI